MDDPPSHTQRNNADEELRQVHSTSNLLYRGYPSQEASSSGPVLTRGGDEAWSEEFFQRREPIWGVTNRPLQESSRKRSLSSGPSNHQHPHPSASTGPSQSSRFFQPFTPEAQPYKFGVFHPENSNAERGDAHTLQLLQSLRLGDDEDVSEHHVATTNHERHKAEHQETLSGSSLSPQRNSPLNTSANHGNGPIQGNIQHQHQHQHKHALSGRTPSGKAIQHHSGNNSQNDVRSTSTAHSAHSSTDPALAKKTKQSKSLRHNKAGNHTGSDKPHNGSGNSQNQRTTQQFKSSYLNWCERLGIAPAHELVKSLKLSLRNQTPFVRLSICHASVDDNHVQAIVNALESHDGINEILLNHNIIGDTGASRLSTILLKNQSITSVELFGNRIGDTSCADMARMLKENQTLKRLKLGDNLIGPQGAEYLAQGLSVNRTLTQLHLGGNKIQVEGLKHLAESLKSNTTLTSLGLRDNVVGSEGIKALSDTLRQEGCALSDIQLKGNNILPQGATYLAEALNVNVSLKVLELQSNKIGPMGVKALCGALKSNHSVHALNFNDNELGDEGSEAVAQLLSNNPSITTLGLANNRIRKRGATSLAESLCRNTAVTGLDLGNNELGNGGAVALADSLKTNNVLTSLDLRSCEIHLKGILALAEMASCNITLRHLDLGANYAKNQGAIAWAHVLANNKTLTRLCLTDNQIYHEGGEALAQALQTNYSLRNFSYGGQGPSANRIDSTIRRIIDSIVSENKKRWEQCANRDGNPSMPMPPPEGPPSAQSARNFAPFLLNGGGQMAYFNPNYGSFRHEVLNTMPGYGKVTRPPPDPDQLDANLEFLFQNKLLKAENPKFPGCYFIGNVINTLRKMFPDTRIDEVQLAQFCYHNPKYYVHLSREMVKTQIKYIGPEGEKDHGTSKKSKRSKAGSPAAPGAHDGGNRRYNARNRSFSDSPVYVPAASPAHPPAQFPYGAGAGAGMPPGAGGAQTGAEYPPRFGVPPPPTQPSLHAFDRTVGGRTSSAQSSLFHHPAVGAAPDNMYTFQPPINTHSPPFFPLGSPVFQSQIHQQQQQQQRASQHQHQHQHQQRQQQQQQQHQQHHHQKQRQQHHRSPSPSHGSSPSFPRQIGSNSNGRVGVIGDKGHGDPSVSAAQFGNSFPGFPSPMFSGSPQFSEFNRSYPGGGASEE